MARIRFTIGQKIYLGFSSLIIIIIIIYVITFNVLNNSTYILKNVVTEVDSSLYLVNQMNLLIKDSKTYTVNWVYIKNKTEDKDSLKFLHSTKYPELKNQLEHFKSKYEQDKRERLDKILSMMDDFINLQKIIMGHLSTKDDYDDILQVLISEELIETDIVPKSINLCKLLSEFIDIEETNSKIIRSKMINSFNTLKIVLILSCVILISLALLISFFSSRSITMPIMRLKEYIMSMSKGNLSEIEVIKTNDEIGDMTDALRQMATNIKKVVEKIGSTSELLVSNGKDINVSSKEIANGASKQVASSKQVSSSMDEITSIIRQNSENAQDTQKIAKKVSENITTIEKAVDDTIDAMQNIADKILIINDIARKIDILSINAAIEASRAGEYGKGFAVVANEIKKLAINSKDAAKVIDEVSSIGLNVVEKSKKIIDDIVPDIKSTERLVENITTSTIEQQSGINQINSSTQQLTKVTQNNTTLADILSAGSRDLLRHSENLTTSISFFTITESENEGNLFK